ncbi:hypothetical protein WA026_013970 [Henosepilachna vigintioctopunctata]|uniref:Transforming acidic coiled-coil-containing protein C-terminal domain-containing protein n=1 Tax=Henosepilachna vigintioctopunctata TaxID=420089 RepID=A0AAW1U7H4_9CUCU
MVNMNLKMRLCDEAQVEKRTLQKELTTALKEGTEHQEKLAELTKTLKELQKKHDALKPKSPVKTKPKETKTEEVLRLEEKLRNIEEKNRILEETVAELGKKLTEKAKNETSGEGMRELKSSPRGTGKSLQLFEGTGDSKTTNREKEFQKVMCEYEELLRRVLSERQNLIEEKNFAQSELVNLKQAFDDLMDKYNRAKEVVEGFTRNEQLMRKQMEDWTKMLISFGKKYTDLKAYAEKKISQANVAIMNKDKGNIEEVAKLKAKLLQSQVKINELQKQVGPKEMRGESLFAPLKNNLKKKQ